MGEDIKTKTDVHNKFMERPPKVLLVLWKYGVKVHPDEAEGLPAFIRAVHSRLEDEDVRIFLVLTNCMRSGPYQGGPDTWEANYNRTAKSVLAHLGLPENTMFFRVNSAKAPGCEPHGLQEVHDAVCGVMHESPQIMSGFKLLPLWRRIAESRVVQMGATVGAMIVLKQPMVPVP